jgi:cell wall-associated NlpC family hydrolase/LysM repeat protein
MVTNSKSNASKLLLAGAAGAGLLVAGGSQVIAHADTVKVQKNDTVWALSQKFGVSIKSIESLNNINQNSHLIFVGQEINVPNKSNSKVTEITVKSGDSLSVLAEKYGVSVNSIMKANKLTSSLIIVGQSLNIPAANTTAAKTASSTYVPQATQQTAVQSSAVAQPASQAPVSSATTSVATSVAPSSAVSSSSVSLVAPVAQKSVATSIASSVAPVAQKSVATSSASSVAPQSSSVSSVAPVAQKSVATSVAPSSAASSSSRNTVTLRAKSSVAPSSAAHVASSVAPKSSAYIAPKSSTAPKSSSYVAPKSSVAPSHAASSAVAPAQSSAASSVAPSSAANVYQDTSSVTALATSLANNTIPYVWGGKTTAGFDCSGFVSYVYQHAAGISLPSYTVAMESYVTKKSVSAAQPGDLLFWGSAGSTYHVGIYLGNNRYANAPTFGQNVKVSTLSSYFYPSFAGSVR